MKKVLLALLALMLVLTFMLGLASCESEKTVEVDLTFVVDGEVYTATKTTGGETIKLPENPTKEGYTFDGWYWDKDVWSKPFTANSLLDAPISSDMSVYAKFSAIEYDITYENDGGTHSNPVSYTIEDSFALSAAERPGYTFVGWYSDAAYTTKVESVSAGSKGAITLYAKFEINNYTISYGNTMDAVNSNVTSYNVNTDTITLSDLSKTGYVFEGWYNGDEKVTEIAKGSTGNITLTAKWRVIGYEITYHNVDGATNSNPTVYDVEDQPLALSDASKDGYRFLGWYTDAALTNKVSEIAIGTTGDINLYAKWELIEYTATFMDGDTEVGKVKFTVETESITEPAVPNHVGYTGAWESYTLGTENITVNAVYNLISYGITYNNVSSATNNNPATYDVEDQPLALVDASKNYYTFLGWYSDAGFNNEVTEISVGTTGPVELYAKWEAIEYTATFMDGNTEVGKVKFTVETESITEPAVPNHVGYTGAWESYTLGTEDITIKAVYSLVTYGITYNNVSGATNNNPTTYNVEDQPLALVDASKAHYTFLGWYSDAEFNNEVTEISVGTTGPVVLYAKWEAVEYTITFLYDNAIGDYAEGTVVKTTYTVEDEFEFAALVCKTVGYTFDGWFTAKNIGTGTKITGVTKGTSGNITVYAQFGLEEYDITYNNVNGASNSNPTHYNVTTEDFTIYPLTKEGYTFDGWFTNEECTTPANLTITKGSNGDITLYAKWTPITYTIEYVTYGGTATGNPTTYIITDNVTFNNATLSGYVFKGWYTAAEGGSKVTGITAGTTGNIILYAHWDYVSTITFESNGGSAVDSISNAEGTAITAPTAPTKEHYTFAGWYSDAALTEEYTFETQPAEDITLYARWTPVVYEIEYVLNGGKNSENNVSGYTVEDKIELHAPSKVGYTFIGWFTDAEFTSSVVTEIKVGTSGKITLYAHYSINQYTITFESNGGTSVSAITQNYATSVTAPEAPSKNGYTFAGWYSNASLTSRYTFSTMPAENITLYAKWNLETYNIIYNLNGGTNNTDNPATYTITSAKITLKAPTKTGYSFAGWYTDAECTEAITEIASGSYGVVELFAKWTATEYTITYVTADGATHSNILTYTIETDLTTLTDATLKGHAFGGWYTDDSYQAAVTTVAGGEIGNKTVYAKFTANTYNVWLDGNEEASCVVSFNLNGAEGAVASQTVTPTATLKYPTVPTRDGYIFAGWYENESCAGSPYDFAAVVTSDTTLYAKWVKVENATAIEINGSANVTLNGKYEQMLTFVPLVSGNITITSSGEYDTFGVLYNSEMAMLTRDDDNASDGKNFLIVYSVTAGETYYIGARAFSSTTSGTANVSISGNNTVRDGGYTVTASKTTVTYGQSFTFNVPDAREGYKFLGYADENGVMYTDATGASVKNWDKDEETTLHSVWESTTYTLTLIDTEDNSEILKIKVRYGTVLNLLEYLPAHSGLSFACWYDNPECTGYPYEVSVMPDEDLTLYAVWEEYSVGSIKPDYGKLAISVNDEITAELFGAICLDSNGVLVPIRVVVNGTQAAGETITVRFIAENNGDTAQATISGIKVYGAPTLTFDDTVDYFNIKDGLSATWFSASGTDTFGGKTTIKVYVDGDYDAGDHVKIVIEAIDPAGNITYGYIENVKAYGAPTISYNESKTAISVSDTLGAELFSATAQDSFGEALTVTVSKYSGTISAGNTVTIRLSATDSKGNVTNIDVLCKVYGAPTISNAVKTDVKDSDEITLELLGITAKDTYGESLNVIISVKDGSQTAGTVMTVTATVTDAAGNITTKDFELKVYGAPTITYDKDAIKVTEDPTKTPSYSVSFNLNGGSGSIASQTVTDTVGLVYPTVPTRSGYAFGGWYTNSSCTGSPYDFSAQISEDVTLYAKWVSMTSSYYSREYVDIAKYNSASSKKTVSITASSGSSQNYYYFTCYEAGSYTFYGSYTSGDFYVYVYNVTKGTTILSKYNLYSSKPSTSTTFTASAGDVIYVSLYKYSSSGSTGSGSFYVSGAKYPISGGVASGDGATGVLNATATDSFGNPLTVTAKLSENCTFATGNYVTYILTATDKLGNVATLETSPIGVYDINDITLSFVAAKKNIKLTSKGEEFNAVATDSFGNACDITIEAAEGYTLSGGNTISLYIVATDKAGNRKYSGIITNKNVYDMPTVVFGSNIEITENTKLDDISFWATVYDSFGEECPAEISLEGDLIAGKIVHLRIRAEDAAKNILDKTYEYVVQCEGHAYTEKEDGTYELTSYTGTNETVEILSSYAGKEVTSIAANAFRNQTTVKKVIIPETVTSIGSCAFAYCTSLTSVTIPNRVTSIGDDAFYGCTGLASVTIGNSVTSIGYDAFYNCTGLASVTIGNSVTSIGERAFYNCTSLADVYITDIAAWCKIDFYNSYSNPLYYAKNLYLNGELVTALKIPAGVTSIGNYAFYNCQNLTSVTIPDGVTSIGERAFAYCTSLPSITIPNSVTSIGEKAFRGCTSLTSVTFENNSQLTSIGYDAFYNCKNLPSVTIPNSVTSIGERAFYNCKKLVEIINLSSLNITKGSSDYGYVAYYALDVYTSTNVSSKLWTDSNGYIFYEDGDTCYLLGYNGSQTVLTLPENCNGKNYKIYSYAFYDCTSLTTITIPNSVTSIGERAFYNCKNLTSVTIPNSVTSIGYYAFKDCTSLTSVTISNSVTSIGGEAFYNCTSLADVYITDIAAWCKISFGESSSNPLNYANNLYLNGELVTNLVIPDSVTSIGEYAFYNCNNLTSITIPNSVTSIGGSAFYSCDKLVEIINLSSLNITKGSSDYGYVAYYALDVYTSTNVSSKLWTDSNGYIFYEDGDTCYLLGYNGIQTVLTLPENCNGKNYKIYGYAFYDCTSLTRVTIPNSVTIIGEYAFYNCKNLTSVTIPNSVTSIGEYAFYNCSNLTSVTIPNSVKIIGSSVFYGCTSLTSVTIPNSVTSIGYYAFKDCTSLTSVYITDIAAWCKIDFWNYYSNPLYYAKNLYLNGELVTDLVIPDVVTSIGEYAFRGCTSLTTITIPNSVTSIGNYAFKDCTSLTSIKYRGTEEQWNAITKGSYWDNNTGSYTITYNYDGE